MEKEKIKMYKPGDTVAGATVLACHIHGTSIDHGGGVLLGWLNHKREYVVWSLDNEGTPGNGYYTSDINKTLLNYSQRSIAKLYAHFNKKAPEISFLAPSREF
jgi:hypothetical protein